MTNIFTGLLWSTKECCPDETALTRLWLHESSRVYGDKLTNEEDQILFAKQLTEISILQLPEVSQEIIFEQPNIFFHFAESLQDEKYMPVTDWVTLNKILLEGLANYNEFVGDMNLVLFEDAMAHICRIR